MFWKSPIMRVTNDTEAELAPRVVSLEKEVAAQRAVIDSLRALLIEAGVVRLSTFGYKPEATTALHDLNEKMTLLLQHLKLQVMVCPEHKELRPVEEKA